MAKNGMNKFMDFLKLSDPEDDFDDDDLFDDDDDFDDYEPPKKKAKTKPVKSYDEDDEEEYSPKKAKAKPSRSTSPSKLVSINSRNSNRSSGTVRVIKPQVFNEAQTITDYLRQGDSILINMEGIEVHAAQRIIDFIGGSCYAIDGTLQAVSANIFIAAPHNIEVTGDLREEILNGSIISPELSAF